MVSFCFYYIFLWCVCNVLLMVSIRRITSIFYPLIWSQIRLIRVASLPAEAFLLPLHHNNTINRPLTDH